MHIKSLVAALIQTASNLEVSNHSLLVDKMSKENLFSDQHQQVDCLCAFDQVNSQKG